MLSSNYPVSCPTGLVGVVALLRLPHTLRLPNSDHFPSPVIVNLFFSLRVPCPDSVNIDFSFLGLGVPSWSEIEYGA
jgi:hypothetical protein